MGDKKKDYKLVADELHEICIENIGEEYRVFEKSDDGGSHIEICFEEKMPSYARKLISDPFMGWRVIFCIVPIGYLEAFSPIREM